MLPSPKPTATASPIVAAQVIGNPSCIRTPLRSNSVSGILGQLTKENVLNEIFLYSPLFLSVFFGGLFGNYLNLKIFSNSILALITSMLVIFVAIRIAFKIFF